MAGTTAKRAPRNRTLTLSAERLAQLRKKLECPETNLSAETMRDRIFCGDFFRLIHLFPAHCADLMVIDPPYNLSKNFHGLNFSRKKDAGYLEYLESWFPGLLRLLKPGGSVYLCGDWQCSAAEYQVLSRHLTVRNRIVWQREKGRGAAKNWKNGCEDIWFATAGNQYYFNADAVKLRRKVLAPYRGRDGQPKDWEATENGKFRMTSPSNFWDDVTVPYWSMPENTDHPTQKPEKLIAKLILASSRPGDLVFDWNGWNARKRIPPFKAIPTVCSGNATPKKNSPAPGARNARNHDFFAGKTISQHRQSISYIRVSPQKTAPAFS